MFYLEPERFQLVGRPSAHNWVEYHALRSGLKVSVERDEWSISDPNRPRKVFRFQLQGPNAHALMEAINGGPIPSLRFFHMGWITIAGRRLRLLQHGMAGVQGGEIFGPYEWRDEVRSAIVEAGRAYGLKQVGAGAYGTNTLESGWISGPVPAVYTSPELESYRLWLPATSYEATGSLGGSFFSPRIEDYYLTPWDLGYGHILKFDHEFVGDAALRLKAQEPHRHKVTLVWNPDDVLQVMQSWLKPGQPGKFIEFPIARYSMWPYDRVVNRQGELVGFSTSSGYSWNERAMLSLAMVDEACATPGTEVVLALGGAGRRFAQTLGGTPCSNGSPGQGGTGSLRGSGPGLPGATRSR